ncbi:MAG: cobalt ECF transporter T component CbiQ [Deltaproteobacteria bacterium]|nr:cobalt ECF transporter T component CbiQ [Deltaproteobacteria bacterium]MBW2071955.1 cobalt ECF transporter T component CbiQ [Deltaproteobacteria bacterium]
MHLDNFAEGESIIHYLDPRIKIIVAALFSFLIALADRPACLLGACCFAVVMLVVARLPLKPVIYRLVAVNTFILFLWFFLPFSTEGEILFKLGPLHATREGVMQALLITVKSNIILVALITLLTTIPIFTLGHALSHLSVPDKLIHLFFFSIRYLQVLHQEYERLRNAMKIRGFTPGTNLHTYRSYAYLLGMLMVMSFDRADRIRKAMLCRGFHGKFYVLSHFHLHRRDVLVGAVLLSLVGIMALLQWLPLR